MAFPPSFPSIAFQTVLVKEKTGGVQQERGVKGISAGAIYIYVRCSLDFLFASLTTLLSLLMLALAKEFCSFHGALFRSVSSLIARTGGKGIAAGNLSSPALLLPTLFCD